MTPEQLAAKGLRVKELVWDDYGSGAAKAPASIMTSYMISPWWDDQFELVESAPGVHGPRIGDGLFPTLEAAKAAAQSDYEARVLAALVEVG